MYSVLMLVLSLPIVAKPMPADLSYQQLGPCHWWQAHTEKGEKLLKALPEKYRAPTLNVQEGKETITGRAEYNPKSKSIYTSPSVRSDIEKLAEKEGLKVEEYDPWEEYEQRKKEKREDADVPEQTEYEKFRAKILEAPADSVTAGFLTVGPTDLYSGCLPHVRIDSGTLKLADGCYECYREGDKAYLRVIQVPKPMPQRKSLFPLLQYLR